MDDFTRIIFPCAFDTEVVENNEGVNDGANEGVNEGANHVMSKCSIL